MNVSDDDVLKTSMHHSGLRDCIAAAISGVDDWRGVTDPAILADAVIEALGLKRNVPPVAPGRRRQRAGLFRYVTEWEKDDCRCQPRYLSEWDTDGGR